MVTDLGRQPAATANQELEEAALAYSRNRGKDELRRVVEAGARLVRHFANLYAPARACDDVVQTGYEGLLKAAGRYDPGRGTAFATYASHCIMGEIRRYIRKEATFYRPGRVAGLQGRVSLAMEEGIHSTGETPSLDMIAASVNVRREGIIQAMRAGWVDLGEVDLSKIQNQRYESFRLPIEDQIALEQALNKLSDLQRRVIALLYYRDLTQTEAAAELGLTQRKVSRILRQSLNQMAKIMA